MIDDPIVSVAPAESRMDLDRVEYRLKDGLERLDVYYSMVPVTAAGQPCGEQTRKHLVLPLDTAAKGKGKDEVIDGLKVGDVLATLQKLAKRQVKAKESNV